MGAKKPSPRGNGNTERMSHDCRGATTESVWVTRLLERIRLLAEVAQLVEQGSEEPPPRGFRKLLDNSRLIPIFVVKEQWSQ
jgi:hypothetical protein